MNPSSQTTGQNDSSLLPSNYVRDEDPAVKRLKELRRKEQIKNGELLKKKNATKRPSGTGAGTRKRKTSQKDEDGGVVGTVYKRRPGSHMKSNNRNNMSTNMMQRREPVKKMTFEELMKQADQNDKVKDTRSLSEPPQTLQPKKVHIPGFKGKKSRIPHRRENNSSHEDSKLNTSIARTKSSGYSNKLQQGHNPNSHRETSVEKPVKLSTLPTNKFAQPNARIKQKLEKKGYRINQDRNRNGSDRDHGRGRYEDEVDSELDDFIEDDDEEEETRHYSRKRDAGYDRNEIWAMFNKGRSRDDVMRRERDSYYSDYDDDDDMEANEMEIMDEEDYATRMAKLEDRKEEAWLKKHEEEKRRKKSKSRD